MTDGMTEDVTLGPEKGCGCVEIHRSLSNMVVVSFANFLMLFGCWLHPEELKVIMHNCETQLNSPLDKNLEVIQSFAGGVRTYLVLVHLQPISWSCQEQS
jgi:hypothetical protein